MVDIIITLTDEEVAELDEMCVRFKSREDYLKFKILQEIKLKKYDKEIATEREKFKKPVE